MNNTKNRLIGINFLATLINSVVVLRVATPVGEPTHTYYALLIFTTVLLLCNIGIVYFFWPET
jgi:hypothetical protein